jgi:outer membrane lipoprotein
MFPTRFHPATGPTGIPHSERALDFRRCATHRALRIRLSCVGALVVALGGCAAEPPSKGPVKDITPLQALEKDTVGDQVRWGGPILTVEPKQDKTCFRMLSFFLGANGEPHLQNQPQGHFLACAKGYYDSAIYAPRRTMTVVGTLGPPLTVKVNGVEHQVATVNVEAVKLWPAPPPRAVVIYTDPWYGPCCAPYAAYPYPYGGVYYTYPP